jgi:hypothetical protein
MIAGIAMLLIMAAGFFVMISGALPNDGGERARARAGHLVLFAVLMLIVVPFAAALLRAVPRTVIVGVLAAASLGAFGILESRRANAPRPQRHRFVSYRASGKVPVHEVEPSPADPDEDAELATEPNELL